MVSVTKARGAIVGIVLLGAASALAGPLQSGSGQTGRLDQRIGAAVPQRYKAIRDAKDWENPYLVIRRDGIEVIVRRLPASRQTVAAADLERTLIGLPVTAWPYGRVAAVQEIGIRAGDRSGDNLSAVALAEAEAIADNLEAALTILKKLDVTVDRWPS